MAINTYEIISLYNSLTTPPLYYRRFYCEEGQNGFQAVDGDLVARACGQYRPIGQTCAGLKPCPHASETVSGNTT